MTRLSPSPHVIFFVGSLLAVGLLSGCSSTGTSDKNDPWESWNRDVHGFNKDFDDNILKPVAKGYDDVVPNPMDEGITNVFSNINDIGVTINDFLQLKFKQGGMDASRFLINTTVGVVGIFDVAKELDLPKHDEDFGQTLGYWGIPSGSYMVLPFLGSSTPRDTVGLIGDALFNPLTYVSMFGGFAANAATAGASAVDVTDTRSDLMQSEKIVNEASVDRYDFMKNAYLQRRTYLVHDGNVPDDVDDPLSGESGGDTTLDAPAGGPTTGSLSGDGVVTTTPLTSGEVKVIDNSTALPKQEAPPAKAPVIDNSRHLLDLTEPDVKQ
jgi:phospholipid-binding lipoprotein MlaA